jgi:ribosomal protein L37AE/L43A
MKARFRPMSASKYDDVSTICPYCHELVVYFRGIDKYIRCISCNSKFIDKDYKESCTAYKYLRDTDQKE